MSAIILATSSFAHQLLIALAQLGQTRIIYQWLRFEQLDQWWHWLLLGLVCAGVLAFVVFWYRRDSVEHPRAVGWALMLLRIAAVAGLLLYFFQFDKRSEQKVVRDSRVAVLIDTSLSMSLPGTPSAVGVPSSQTRAAEAASLLAESDFLALLAQKHELSIYRFDQLSRPISLGALEKSPTLGGALSNDNLFVAGESGNGESGAGESGAGQQATAGGSASAGQSATDAGLRSNQSLNQSDILRRGRTTMLVAIGLGFIALLALVVSLGAQVGGARNWRPGGWLLLIGSGLALASLAVSAVAIIPTTAFPLAALFGAQPTEIEPDTAAKSSTEEGQAVAVPDDWYSALSPTGAETHFGDVVKSVLDQELGGSLAGIVVLTDGRSNAGVDPRQVISAAQAMRVPIYAIGLGSERSPSNLQLVEIDVPQRLYPGDRFSLNALIGSSGFAGKTVTVQITAGPTNADVNALGIEAEKQVEIPADGSIVSAKFELEPKAVGEWQYAAKVLSLPGEMDEKDNFRSTTVEVIERKNRVLILAGGPTREYQFVRNLLYRDRDVESHVMLQSGSEGTSQEAQKLLSEFPAGRSELSDYDAVLAFDADWTQIPDRSVQALEQWVAEQAGGFLLVAGTVEMPKWTARSASGTRSQNLRSLSPVVLEQGGSNSVAGGRIDSPNSWPLKITADGLQTDFMWLSDDAQTSGDLWDRFDGVYSYSPAYELKPGAKALALFSDPTSAIDGQQPIYIASQFYGAGRVVFLGGGELWRLRRQGDQYFDRFYTKLVRWISQGRLLMDSDRGVLLVDREQATLGDQVVVRAVLKDERYEPLLQSEVVARLIDSQGRNQPMVLRPMADGSQPGVYTGQFAVQVAGDYLLQLQLGGLASDEVLNAKVVAKVPAREMQQSERNDALLRQLAVETGGKYWPGVQQAVSGDNTDQPISQWIQPQDQVAYLPGAPDRVFQIRWLGWLMAWIAGSLSLEWLARRLHRLA